MQDYIDVLHLKPKDQFGTVKIPNLPQSDVMLQHASGRHIKFWWLELAKNQHTVIN